MGSMFRVSKNKINENNDDYITRFLAGMKVLVTGINGFIGRYVAKLLSTRHEVFGTIRSDNLARQVVGVEVISADLEDPNFIDKLPSDIDCVIHLAQSRLYRSFPEGAEDMSRINITATCRLLEWSRKTRVKKFIFTSTANVYGEFFGHLNETHSTNPSSFYGATKLAAEHLVTQYQHFFNIHVLRLFTVYGPGQKKMLVSNIINNVKTGDEIFLAQKVGLKFTPIFIDDLVEIISKIITHPPILGTFVLNICGSEITTLNNVVNLVGKILGKSANIKFTDDEPKYFIGSNQRLIETIGHFKFCTMEQGLKRTLA